MKVIKKEASFCGKNNQKFYHERFGSYKEFYEVLMSRQNNAHKTIQKVLDEHSEGWTGVGSVDEATKLFLNGWQKNVEVMKRSFREELNVLEYKKPVKMISSVSGFMPIVPNALLGLPNSMINVKIGQKKSKILNFMVAIDRAASNDVGTIIEKMSKIFAYIAMLERSGQYRCRIEVFFTAFGDHQRNSINTSASVLVKSESQLFDIKRLCFPVIHPAMLRLFMFAWEESLPMNYNDYAEGGYGRSFEYWGSKSKEEYINVVNENNEKTICLDLFSNIDKMLREGGVV